MTTSDAGGTIFVSVAAYRDPQLLPTLADCLAKARRPDRLRFGVCWQYGGEIAASEQLQGEQFAVHFVDSRLSLGACWARSEIMKLYRGEDWYLQLDSHHRFVQDWDLRLIEQAALTDSEKPVLSTYAAEFTPGAEASAPEQVTRMEFDRFTDEGAVLFRGGLIAEAPAGPVPARFVSAHFLFAPGSFVHEVPYDPELYFIGEEITLAVRAFTHGYDLFHPGLHILWHEYTRTGRAKHWDDHTSESGISVPWHERDAASLAKVGRLLTEPRVGRDGFGSARTLADYEDYAGISFRHRCVQDYTREERQPPNPTTDREWATRIQDHRIEIRLDRGELPTAALGESSFCYVGVHDSGGREIFRRDAEPAELSRALAAGNGVTLIREFSSEREPASWTAWPYSASEGWLQPVRRPVAEVQRIFVSVASYRDPDLVATVADCLAMADFPDQLRLVVCWQHGPGEVLPDWMRTAQFDILDVNCGESLGACWARSAIMERWAGEEWFLQIDSHMRFAQGWDTTLLHQAALTGSPKPLLSAPAPPFTVGGSRWYDSPLCFEFAGFDPKGVPDIQMGFLPAEAVGGNPVRARSVCGHFLFAPGSFAREVPYDPEMYFSAEQTTLAVRAFTHGYDLFHPTSAVVWHEYSRDYRTQHWDDHTAEQDVDEPWEELYQKGLAKVAQFFAAPSVGQYGLGEVRTVRDYEAYAGVDFRARQVQDYTRLNQEPPSPVSPAWTDPMRDHRVEIFVDLAALPSAALEEPKLWYVGVHDAEGRELHRQDVSGDELASILAAGDPATFVREFTSRTTPASWTVLPMQTDGEWLEPLTGPLAADAVSTADRLPLAVQ